MNVLPIYSNPDSPATLDMYNVRDHFTAFLGAITVMFTTLFKGIFNNAVWVIQALSSAACKIWSTAVENINDMVEYVGSCIRCCLLSPMTYHGFGFISVTLLIDIFACIFDNVPGCMPVILTGISTVFLVFANRATILEVFELRQYRKKKNNLVATMNCITLLRVQEMQQGQNGGRASILFRHLNDHFAAWKTDSFKDGRRRDELCVVVDQATDFIEESLGIKYDKDFY